MKFIRLSRDKQYALIGESANKAQWYTVAENVKRFVESLQADEEVTIRFEKKDKSNILTFISKNGNGSPVSVAEPQEPGSEPTPAPSRIPSSYTKNTYEKSATKSWGKTPAEQDSIKRQAIGHMTSRTLIALQGQVSPDNVQELMTQIYQGYQELVG